jgi:aminodeoxyfutalosine deaminase
VDETAGTSTDDMFVDALPKVELHVHLEGSMRPATLLALARRHRIDNLPADLGRLREFYSFRDFAHFIDVYLALVQVLRDESDFALLARETALDLARQRVRYAEVTFTPWLHAQRGVDPVEMFAGIERGRRDAEEQAGIQIRWITDIPGLPGSDNRLAAERTVELALTLGRGAVIGLGLGGPEEGVPRPQFAEAFTAARDAGLHSVPHAGETTGPRTVWDALEFLHAERIGHGTSALADPVLVEHLRTRAIPLEVCPTSNVRTGAVGGYADHPLPAMLKHGLAVSLNTDDPPLFNTTLRDEYLHALRELGLSRDALVAVVDATIDQSFLPGPGKDLLHAELADTAAAWGVRLRADTGGGREAAGA